jgi:hypothetical protein
MPNKISRGARQKKPPGDYRVSRVGRVELFMKPDDYMPEYSKRKRRSSEKMLGFDSLYHLINRNTDMKGLTIKL